MWIGSNTLFGSVCSLLLVFLAHLGSTTMVTSDGSLSFLAIEECSSLLEGATLGLDDEQVDEDELEDDPAAVHDLPGNQQLPVHSSKKILT
jgi:hypothetical protein